MFQIDRKVVLQRLLRDLLVILTYLRNKLIRNLVDLEDKVVITHPVVLLRLLEVLLPFTKLPDSNLPILLLVLLKLGLKLLDHPLYHVKRGVLPKCLLQNVGDRVNKALTG